MCLTTNSVKKVDFLDGTEISVLMITLTKMLLGTFVRDSLRVPPAGNTRVNKRGAFLFRFVYEAPTASTVDSIQRKTTPNILTLGKINMTKHYIL